MTAFLGIETLNCPHHSPAVHFIDAFDVNGMNLSLSFWFCFWFAKWFSLFSCQ
ncbi:hypothetical protein ACE6H2_012008 [Prunus campanulata]